MLAQKLRVEDVMKVERELLTGMDFWIYDGKEAEKMLTYVDGVLDAVDAVIKVIEEREDT